MNGWTFSQILASEEKATNTTISERSIERQVDQIHAFEIGCVSIFQLFDSFTIMNNWW